MLRLWLDGKGFRSVERLAQVDRKTVRRYVEAAVGLGLKPWRRRGPALRRVHRGGGGGGPSASQRRPRRGVAPVGGGTRPGRGVAEPMGSRSARSGSCLPGGGWWSRSAPCTVARARGVRTSAGAGELRRCGSRIVSRATSCRSTSVAWAASPTGATRAADRDVWALIFTACYSRHESRTNDTLRSNVRRLPGGWRGCTLTSWPRWNTRTRTRSARTSTREPIKLPGIEYSALATSM